MKKKNKLTKEQIQQIEDYLTNKDVEYIDLRYEILDHIISDVEFIIENSSSSFEDTLDKVKLKWNKNFTITSSWWLGVSNYVPLIFINKCLRIYKPLVLKNLFGIVLFLIFIYAILYFFQFDLLYFYSVIKMVYIVSTLTFIGFFIFWKIKIKRIKQKSSFSYLINKQIFPNIFFLLILLSNLFDAKPENVDFFDLIILSTTVSVLLIGNSLYKNHVKIVSNFKKYQLK